MAAKLPKAESAAKERKAALARADGDAAAMRKEAAERDEELRIASMRVAALLRDREEADQRLRGLDQAYKVLYKVAPACLFLPCLPKPCDLPAAYAIQATGTLRRAPDCCFPSLFRPQRRRRSGSRRSSGAQRSESSALWLLLEPFTLRRLLSPSSARFVATQ